MTTTTRILTILCICILLWLAVAFRVFLARNPKCNSTAAWGHIDSVLKFEQLEQYQ